MDQKARYELFARLRAAMPNPSTELRFTSPFELLIAVLLSAQATDKSVNKATAELFRYANTPQQMLALGEEGVRQVIRSIGLFNTKARNVIAACRILVEQHGGCVPRERAALEALPGVGRKTANVILNTVFGDPTIAVDTHIFRVANRTGLAPQKTPQRVEEMLLKVVPEEFLRHAHHWLVLHGRYVCTAHKPRCRNCPIQEFCEFPNKLLD
ncbi:MAG: endonuclease III [Gammaproteobacteria bacterium]